MSLAFDEVEWWGTCANSWHEEHKQFSYAQRMGLRANWAVGHPPQFDGGHASIIDIGGGPVSLLLKTINRQRSVVMDPGEYPKWVERRYAHCGIEFWRQPGEELSGYTFDEAWIYNTLQHVQDPEQVIRAAYSCAETIRLFEWVGMEPYPGHPHLLEPEFLDGWLGSSGFVAELNENGAVGTAYYGVFRRPSALDSAASAQREAVEEST